MHPVKLFCWHFMAYPYLPEDFDEKYDTGWVTVPNSLWNREKAKGLYQEYIDQLVYADELGFDGMVLNEHHQNIYGLMPSPNMIAAALSQRTKNGKIVVLGNILPMHLNPLRIAEEYAMLDCMSGGRLIAGFAVGGGPEAFNYDVPSPRARRQFWEAIDLIVKTWTDDGPFVHEGPEYPLRTSMPGRGQSRRRIHRCGYPALGRAKPWKMPHSEVTPIFCRRAAMATRRGKRLRLMPQRWLSTTAATRRSISVSCCRYTFPKLTNRRKSKAGKASGISCGIA